VKHLNADNQHMLRRSIGDELVRDGRYKPIGQAAYVEGAALCAGMLLVREEG
jgi:hypothetical protein